MTEFTKGRREARRIIIGLSTLAVLIAASATLFVLLHRSQRRLQELGEVRHQSYLLADQLRQSSDDLTRMVRTYAATGHEKFHDQFWEVLAIRNGESPRPENYERIFWDFLAVGTGGAPFHRGETVSLRRLMQESGFTERELSLLQQSQDQSDDLVNLERQAMAALQAGGEGALPTDEGRRQALALLFSEEYHQAKVRIMEPINTFLSELDARTDREVQDQARRLHRLLLAQALTYILSVGALLLVIGNARKFHRGLVDILSELVEVRTAELQEANASLRQALQERDEAARKVETLGGLLPICSVCKKIRDDGGYWNQIESYLHQHSLADFSHSICPDCARDLYGEYLDGP